MIALGLAALLLSKNRTSAFYRSVAAVLSATAVMQMGNGLGLIDAEHALTWRRLALLGELAQPVAFLYAGLAVMGPANLGLVQAARWRARAVALLAAVWGVLAWSDQVYAFVNSGRALSSIGVGSVGRVTYVFILFSVVLGMAQLEQVLRAARDPLRFRLKFVLIGLGALGGYSVYQASRLLLSPVWQSEYVLVGRLALLMCVGLMAYGLAWGRLGEVRAQVYVSPQALYRSITFLSVGLYLLAVGVVAETLRYIGKPLTVGLSLALVFAAVVVLVVVLLARQPKAELRRFVSRHFYRSKYDYRAKWIEVTEAFLTAHSMEAILDQLLSVLSQTFGAERISIWMHCDADGRFHQVRSVNTNPIPPPLDISHPVVSRLVGSDEPLELSEAGPKIASSDSMGSSGFIEATRAVLCMPIRSESKFLAFITLSRKLQGESYGTDDLALLWAMSRHVAVLLSHALLAEERSAALQLEALQRFSVFCLHDLKNLTTKLSLVVQNAKEHGEDPAFQKSAMRAVAGTVQKMMALMTKLSRKVEHPDVPELVDVHEVISETVSSVDGNLRMPVETAAERLPPVCIVREQFHQVLLNVILNAQQATQQTRSQASGEWGVIRISTEQANGTVVVTVADSGPGIPATELRSLFQPFRSTKQGGLGIGLYECKRILEANHGAIRVESEVGRGTRVRIELPVAKEGERLEAGGVKR